MVRHYVRTDSRRYHHRRSRLSCLLLQQVNNAAAWRVESPNMLVVVGLRPCTGPAHGVGPGLHDDKLSRALAIGRVGQQEFNVERLCRADVGVQKATM